MLSGVARRRTVCSTRYGRVFDPSSLIRLPGCTGMGLATSPAPPPVRRPVLQYLEPALVLTTGVGVWYYWPSLSAYGSSAVGKVAPNKPTAPETGPRVELVPGNPAAIQVPKELLSTPRFKTAVVADAPSPEPLTLQGTTFLDPNRNSVVHSLFPGQVMKVGLRGDTSKTSEQLSNSPDTGLRPGDDVKQGQILLVIWCKDVGEKKSELVDAVARLRADQKVLDRYKSVEPGVVTLNAITNAEQAVESDRNAVAKAERTLRSWLLNDDDISAVYREADKVRDTKAPRDKEVERSWAEVAIRAPFDGVIVEKNVTVGDVIDPSKDLVKIAKLDRLQVLMNAYEEQLPLLRQLARAADEAAGLPSQSPGLEALRQAQSGRSTKWTLTFQANGATETAAFDRLGVMIDPMQHTGTVTGWVDNSRRNLFVGQFVTATVPLKPDPSLVAVPTGAVVEDAAGTAVYVATDPAAGRFVRKKVAVAVRGREQIFLRKQPTPAEAARGAEPIQPGQEVLAAGAIELAG